MNRSRDGALDVLLKAGSSVRSGIDDKAARELLTDDLIRAVFEAAWRHQFDEDRSGFRAEVKQIVNEVIEAKFLKEAAK